MYNSIFYDFLKINLKRTNRSLLWSAVCLLFLTLTSLSFAQQHIVVPNSLENIDGLNRWNFFNNQNQKNHILIDESQLTAFIGQEISGISFRLPGTNNNDPETEPWPSTLITYNQFDVYLSQGVAVSNISNTFSNNIVGAQTQVRAGQLSIAPESYPIGDPADFGPTITFDTPYPYSGGTLLLEIRHSESDYATANNFVNAINNSHPDNGVNVASVTSIGANINENVGSPVFNTPIVRFYTSGTQNTCPNITNINKSNSTYTSVDVSWDAGGTETLWNIQWGTETFNPNVNTGTAIGTANGLTTPNYSITGLTADTNYDIYVQADCGSGDLSVWKSITFFSGYCVPSTNFSNYTANFSTTNALVNVNYSASEQPTGSYQDATNMHIITQLAGLSFNFSHTYSPILANHLRIWVDWNNDLVFDDDEEVYVGYISSSPYIQTGTITIPPNITNGNYRMRSRSSWSTGAVFNVPSCGLIGYGSTIDYTINVVDQPTCIPITNISISNPTSTSVDVSWDAGGTETLWNIQWGTETFNPNTNTGTAIGTANGLTTPNYSITGLTADTNYQIYVQADCGGGDTSFFNSIPFFSGYCVPITTNTSDYTSAFSTTNAFVNVNYTGNQYGYVNNSSQNIVQSAGLSFDFSHTYVGGINTVRIWVDWNNDLVFDDDLEEVYLGYEGSSPYIQTGTITIPANTPVGNYRMRVRSRYTTIIPSPCSSETYGTSIDFTLSVIAPQTCLPVSLPITATNSSATSVLLEWVSDGTSFDIEYGEVGFTQGSGTMLTEVPNPYTLTGLTAGNNYQYYVRQNCGNGDESIWQGPVSFTPGSFTGKISSILDTEPEVTSIACGSTFNVEVPTGKQIASLKVEYTITSASPRSISEQRSVLYSPTLNAGEMSVVSGNQNDNFAGFEDYSRFVDFANGATGTVEFELKAWRVAGNPDCTDDEIFVEAGTWILSPTFEDIPDCSTIVSTPTGETSQNFNNGQTIADLVVNGTNLVWYSDSALTITIPTTTTLTNATTYYVVSESGICKSSALAITVTDCVNVVSTPTGETSQNFNNGQTIADLVVNGSNLVWYSDNTYLLTLSDSEELVDGTTYYVVSEVGNCQSEALAIMVTDCVNVVSTPTGETSQDFTAGQTIADLVVNGSNLVWYSDNTYSLTLSDNELLVDGTTYYVVSEVGNCQSDPLIITVTQVVSRSDFDLYRFSYHPNPVNDILYFSSNSKIEKVVISNILGQQISANLNSDNTILDMSDLSSGNYFVKITIEGVSKTIKVVKK